MGDSGKLNSSMQDFDQWASRILEDERFVDILYEKIRARDIARREKSAQALAQSLLEGAGIIRERLYGTD